MGRECLRECHGGTARTGVANRCGDGRRTGQDTRDEEGIPLDG